MYVFWVTFFDVGSSKLITSLLDHTDDLSGINLDYIGHWLWRAVSMKNNDCEGW